jgi:hypothetical protein
MAIEKEFFLSGQFKRIVAIPSSFLNKISGFVMEEFSLAVRITFWILKKMVMLQFFEERNAAGH